MARFKISLFPSPEWDELCLKHNDIFNSTFWHHVLSEGFGTQTLYMSDLELSINYSLSIFKAGPFKIAYLGFPLGGGVDNLCLTSEMVLELKKIRFPVTIHSIKIPVSPFLNCAELTLKKQVALETAILNLQRWKPEKHNKIKRVMNKLSRQNICIQECSEKFHPDDLYKLYRDTIMRHQGNIRYNNQYFKALFELSRMNSNIKIFVATLNKRIAGFVVCVCHQNTAYYLHGSMDMNLKEYYPSDLLFYHSIQWAKNKGMECYNMLSSPKGQISLVKYKEKWGGETRVHKTYELNLNPLMTTLYKCASGIYHYCSFLRK